MAPNKDKWHAVLQVAMNLCVPYNAVSSLTPDLFATEKQPLNEVPDCFISKLDKCSVLDVAPPSTYSPALTCKGRVTNKSFFQL